ncbi:uncharacterized protein LOC132951160 [Metopolophium dirhodum]|uniref:uncharacterized protein LOC132951160 n=1 Tax=Metopolophium dirhodum TaxID=44670 RepID=UPI00298FB5CF|nr:uncharacterized protein LOC132951160 [Metopolophium dirhodum]
MSRYKFLILILMIMKSLYYSEAGNNSDTNTVEGGERLYCINRMHNGGYPRIYETYVDYMTRISKGKQYKPISNNEFVTFKSYCPNIGEIYDEYFNDRQDLFEIVGYSETEFTAVLKSYPTFLETKSQFLSRIDFGSLGLDQSTSPSDYYIGLRSLYPIFAESHIEYSARIETKGLVPMKLESFILYQAYYPNLCVQYIEFAYTMDIFDRTIPRFKKLKLYLYSEDVYDRLKTIFPKPFESQVHFYNRLTADDFNLIYDRFYAKRMYPKMSETYEEYCNRINSIFFPDQTELMTSEYKKSNWLRPIPYHMFVEYKKNYPQFLYLYNEINFEEKNNNIPYRPVLEQIDEAVTHYTDEALFNIDYDAIYTFLLENNASYIHQRNLVEIHMDIITFKLLVKRLPNVYENYQIYRQRMFMLATNILDEEEVNDLKKVYIRQCEKYEDYRKRMKQMDINPTSREIADKFKMTVPREYEKGGEHQYFHFLSSDRHDKGKNCFIYGYKNKTLPFFLEYLEEATPSNDDPESVQKVYYDDKHIHERQVYNEHMLDYHYIKAFSYPSYKAFKYVLPRPFEKYGSYERRINKFRKDYDFSDYEDLNCYARDIFKSFIQPLTKDEFLDLKLRFPKLSETPREYEDRLETDYSLDIAIDNHQLHLFHLIKHSQIQLYDDYKGYEKRFQKLVINRRKFLKDFGISLLNETEFKLFKEYLPTRPYVIDYSAYTIDMKMKGDTEYMLDVNDYDDFMKVFPKYYDTFEEFNELMKHRYLDPVSKDYFKIFKEIHPHFFDKDFKGYSSRILNYSLSTTRSFKNELTKFSLSPINNLAEFDTFMDNIPRPFEPITAYKKRLPNVSMKSKDYERFKRIYPKVSSTISEYSMLMESMEISKADEFFIIYKNQLPNVSDKETYDVYMKKINDKQSFMMTEDEYRLWFLRLPKAPERYLNHIKTMIKLKENNVEVEPLEKHEFDDLKNLFSIPYETYKEHYIRLKSYNLRKLTRNQFIREKAYRVLVGETYKSHVERIRQLFNEPDYDLTKEKIVEDHGIETLIPNNFAEHVLSYPFNYDTLKKFLSRQEIIKSDLDPDPLVKTEIWYKRMKNLLPRINENIQMFKERVKTYKLLFPEITEIQFYRHKYALPHPAESYTTFYSRTQYIISDNKQDETSPADPAELLMEHKKELYDIFVALSPNFLIDHPTYCEKVKEYEEPLDKDEFFVFKQCLPKLQDSILEHNNKITLMGLAEVKDEPYNKLKIFYPRIYHISYDNYILNIELKYGKEANDLRGVIDALKLSRNEFTEYKNKFPKLFEFSYVTYRKRMENKDMFTKEEFMAIRKANFPLPDENYKQHKSKMDSLDLDPIPYDVFCFLKGLYPDVFELRYSYRITKVYKELQRVNYLDAKYKLCVGNEIVSEIIERSKPYLELQNKVQNFLLHMMTSEEFNRLTKYFPMVFKPYSNFVDCWNNAQKNSNGNLVPESDVMDEELFKSFKKAYFVSLNETYVEYKTRMKSLKLTAVPSNYFRYFKSVYPHLFNTYQYYSEKTGLYRTFELRNIQSHLTNKIESIGYYPLPSKDYTIFQKYFPRIFDSHTNYLKNIFEENEHNKNEGGDEDLMPIIFNHDEFDSIKTAYYPRLSENYDSYKARMFSLGLWVLEYKTFKSFKAVYPNPTTSAAYSEYKKVFENIDNNEGTPIIGIRHIMTEEEFGIDLIQDFPKLFESWEEFDERRLISSSKDKTNRLFKDDGIFSKNLFNDIKIVYYPKLGQNFILFVTINNSLELPANTLRWMSHYQNVIKLYPMFFESFDDYEVRLKGMPLECLKLNEKMFYTFFEIFPFPYESYPQYKIRNAGATYKLSEEEFTNFRLVFPLISETYNKYKQRLGSELSIEFMEEKLFELFKSLFPQIDETYETYKSRVDDSLMNSNETTQKQLAFFVEYMKFHALDYKTYEGTDFTAETSRDTDTVTKTIEGAEITAETSRATYIKTYGAMTYEEFKAFKLSLPIPNELREDYIFRINKLVLLRKCDDTAEEVKPEILPLKLFQDLLNWYPKDSKSNYDDYCKEMKDMKNIPVSSTTFNELLTVSKSMNKNPFTFDDISFYKIIVTSRNQKSHPSWPWYVDKILARRKMKKTKFLTPLKNLDHINKI